MNKLIKITTNEDEKQIVSAKELYLGLGLNKTQWSRWYPGNIQKNDFFKEDIDWVGVRHNVEGNGSIDFAISIDFAKHIAMQARTEKSHEYRNYFISCEKKLKENVQAPLTTLSPQLQLLINMELEQKKIKEEVAATKQLTEGFKEELQGIRDVVAINSADWKDDCKNLIVKIAHKLGGFNHIQDVYKEVYSSLEKRMGCQLSVRLTNKRRRMADEGVCKSKRDKLNKIDVIADDKKLIEGYISITKELSIKYGIA